MPVVFVVIVRMRMRIGRVRMSMRVLRLGLIGMPMMIVMRVLVRMSQRGMGMRVSMIGHESTSSGESDDLSIC